MVDTASLRKPVLKQEELKNLPAEQRMKILLELRDELKKREEDTKVQQAELRAAVELHQQEVEELGELEKKGKEEIETLEGLLPKQKEVKVEDLFKPTEALDDKLGASEKRQQRTPEEEKKYIAELSQKPMAELYKRFAEVDDKVRNAYEDASSAYKSQDDEERRHLAYAIRKKEDAALAGTYTASQEILEQMGAFENRIKKSYNQ